MRVLTMVGMVLVGGASALSGQHAHQLEFGGFGSYTRYDPTYGFDNAVGGGLRLGYLLSDAFGFEVEGGMASPNITGSGGAVGTAAAFGSASLVLNSGGEHNILYVLGGYTRLRLGGYSPYTNLNEVHGGLGDRIFFGSRVALRLEARAYYAPGDQLGTGQAPLNITGSAGLSLFLLGGGGGGQAEAPEVPKAKRDSIIAAGGTPPPEPRPTKQVFLQKGTDWTHQWFWGGQAGVLVFKTDADGLSAEPTFGGHWLVTGKRTALYAAYEQSFFLTDRHATLLEPGGTIEAGNVAFRTLRRIMMGVLAFPAQKAVQPFAGGGFAILEILNPVATCTGCSLSNAAITQAEADDAATKAAFWWMAGIDVRQGRMSLYGHYILTSAVNTFLISGVMHTFQGGIRYSLGSSREDPTDEH